MNMPPDAGPHAAAPGDDGLDELRLATVSAHATAVRLQIAATAVVVSALVWRDVPGLLVLGWVAFVLGVREWRAWWLERLVADAAQPIALRLKRLVASNLAIGLCNGAAAFFMAWLDRTYDALLTMILVSWAAGAVSTSAPYLRAYAVYSLCVFSPLIFMWLLEWTLLGAGIAALIAMFALVQLRFARQNAAVFEESYRIRLENVQLVRQLAEARDVAEAANRAKSRFLAAASHDLRQPLHALTLHSGLLAQDPRAPDAAAIAGEISGSIDALGRLLDSLLDISKLDAGVVVVEPRPIRLQRLVAHVARMQAPRAAEKGLALVADCPADAIVQTDPLLLERLLGNLLDNAVKYTDRGTVGITVRADGDELLLSVHDTGRGIPPQMQSRVFEEFFQVESTARQTEGGLGLGLAIVQRLAALLGLPLAMRSAPGEGTTVELRLARARLAPEEQSPAPGPDPALGGLKVLFIDDEEAVRRAMQAVLQRFGCEARTAAGTEEALQAQAQFEPGLVLADYSLGDGDTGIEAIRRLREQQPGLPALLISGNTDGTLMKSAERSGLRLLHKPVTLARLREAIAHELAARPLPDPPASTEAP